MSLSKPELLAPAGNWECLRAAVAAGADAVYFGLPVLNARMRADNFSMDDLPEIVAYLRAHDTRSHVTMNTLVFTSELSQAASMRSSFRTSVSRVSLARSRRGSRCTHRRR